MGNQSILVIDNEPQIRKHLTTTLQSNNYTVLEATTGTDGINMVTNNFNVIDLVLMNIELPDISGYEVLKNLRAWYSKPIIIISTQTDEQNIVKALDSGADDFIAKPLRTPELLARINSVMNKSNSKKNSPIVQFRDLTLDFAHRVVKRNNNIVSLTPAEYQLFVLMVKHEGKLLTYRFILGQMMKEQKWNDLLNLNKLVAQLKSKIETDLSWPAYIISESGFGYRFVGHA